MNRFFVALTASCGASLAAQGASITSAFADAPAAIVASPSPSPSGTLREIGRVVTSDRRAESAGVSSRPTFVIDRAQIDAFGAKSVADALQGVPGVDVFSYGTFGAQADYGLRGSSSAQTLVLVDGISVADPTTGAVELGHLSTIGVDRIEVVESGSSTLYGTSASGGVINVITKVPRGVYLDASDASYSDRDVRVGAGNGVAGFTVERHVSNGNYGYPSIDYGKGSACKAVFTAPCTFPAGVRTPGYGDQSAGRFSVDLPAIHGFEIRARLDSIGTQTGVPGSVAFLTTTARETDLANSALIELERGWRHSTLTVDFAGAQTRLSYDDPVFNSGESDVYTGRTQVSVRDAFEAGRFDGVGGVDLSRESGVFAFPTAPNYSSPTAPPIPAYAFGKAQSQSAAYLQLGVAPMRGTRLVAGVRGENDAPQGSVLAPSLGGTIAAGQVTFAGNVGESFRVPTLQDLYYPGFSNPDLLPEKAQTADATVSYEAHEGRISVGWFDRNGTNFIISRPPTYVPANAQHASVAGVQVTASSRPRGGFVAAASYTDLYRALDLGTGGRLPRYSAGTVTFSLEHPFALTRSDFGLRWDIVGSDGDDRSEVSGPLAQNYVAYDSLDAYFRYKLAPNTVVSVRGFNLGDEHVAPIFGYPAPGRRFAVEISTR